MKTWTVSPSRRAGASARAASMAASMLETADTRAEGSSDDHFSAKAFWTVSFVMVRGRIGGLQSLRC